METLPKTPLAIIGMACRLPGANDLDSYWNMLIEGRSPIAELPPDRLDQDLYYCPEKGMLGKTYSRIAALVDYASLDFGACGLSAETIAASDLGHLTFCTVAAQACRHAGLDPRDLAIRNAGVFVGHSRGTRRGGDFVYAARVGQTAQYLREVPRFQEMAGQQSEVIIQEIAEAARRPLSGRAQDDPARLSPHWAAALVSRTLGLSGPVMVLNAACASALHALAMAGRALRLGQIDMAIVGGASYCKPDTLILFSQAQSMSATGSRPFDAEADGLVVGEGYASIVVKTLPRALADGDRILAVVRGIGVSSDGRGKSVWAPQKKGQIEAVRRAYANAHGMARLQYVEAHATSTPLGDATEMAALAAALGENLPPGTKLPVGCVKANIGHTLEAAGLAGLIKTVLAMQHEVIPRQIHFRTPSPRIRWQEMPFFIPTENRPWPAPDDGAPRAAAVNSFGIGGMNVHVVVDEFNGTSTIGGTVPPPRSSASGPSDEIAIVGAACILPGARTLEAFWHQLLCAGDGSPQALNDPLNDYRYDWRRHKVPPLQVERANLLQFMVLDAVDAALRDAGYDRKPYDRQRTGVIVGATFDSDFSDQLQMAIRLPDFQRAIAEVLRKQGVPEPRIAEISAAYGKLLVERLPALLDETGSFTTSTLASRITKTFDLMGDAVVLDCGEASSLAAVSSAVDVLRDGACEMVICAAGQKRAGVPGEGVGVLVLKRLADARRDGDCVRGILRGVGAGHAAHSAEAMALAVRRAMESSAAGSEEATLAEATGAGMPGLLKTVLAVQRDRWPKKGHAAAGVGGSDPCGAAYHLLVAPSDPLPLAEDRRNAAFLFADVDARQPRRLLALMRQLAPAAAAAGEVDATLARLGLPRLDELVSQAERPSPERSTWDRLALLSAETIAAGALRAMGVQPDCVAGYGYGRYAALVAAGAWTFAAAAQAIAAPPTGDLLDTSEIGPPAVPYLCSVTSRYAAEPEELLASLAKQGPEAAATDLVCRLADEGASVFWEIGPEPAISRLRHKAIAGRPITIWTADDLCRPGESLSVAFRSAKAAHEPRNFRGAKGDNPTVASSPVLTERGTDTMVPPESGPQVCHRFVMRMVEATLPPTEKELPTFQGAALLVGQNALSGALRARIQRHGAEVHELAVSDDIEGALATLERMWQAGPIPHLFLLAAHDDDVATDLDEQPWGRRQFRTVEFPYLVCQRWFQLAAVAGLLDRASVVAATALGGDFGFAGHVRGVDGGAMAGLIKGIRLEVLARGHEAFRAKVVDLAADIAPEQAADLLLGEWAAGDKEVEVGHAGGTRRIVRAVEQACSVAKTALSQDGVAAPAGTWIITGGARGVTAVVARELGRRFGMTLNLIGSSPPPQIEAAWRDLSPEGLRELRAQITRQAVAEKKVPIEAWKRVEKAMEMDRNLRMLSESGIKATYHVCDVSDRAALGTLLKKIRAADGPIHGIVHGAGVESSCRFEKKRRDMVSRTISVKVGGAAALMDLTRSDPVRCFLAFGSISGRFGGQGQTDYCLANEMLSKLVDWHRRQRPDCRSTTFQWHSWADVGMAVRPESSHIKHLAQMEFMPSLEGANHLIDEVLAGVPEPEIVITERRYCHRFHPPRTHQAPRDGSRPDGAPYQAPLINMVRQLDRPRRLTAEVTLDPTADPFLRDHRYKDKPILPAAIGLEIFAEAAALLGEGQIVTGLRQFQIHRALQWFSDRAVAARVVAEATPEGIACQLTSDFHDRQGRLVQKDRLHLSAIVELAQSPSGDPALPVTAKYAQQRAAIPPSWDRVIYTDDPTPGHGPQAIPQGCIDLRLREQTIFHGPPLRCLREVKVDDRGGWGRVVVSPWQELAGGRPGDGWLAAPDLLDASLLVCGTFLWERPGRQICLPQAIARLRLGRKPRVGEACIVRMECREPPVFDLVAVGEDNAVILEIEGYRGQILG